MKQIFSIIAVVVVLLPIAYAQTTPRLSPTQKPAVTQPTGTTNTISENSVSGSLTFNGKTVTLPYAYAKSGAANYNPGVHLYFTDRPIVEAVAEDQFQTKARAGELNGIYVRMDAAAKRVVGYEIGCNKEYLFVSNDDYLNGKDQGFSGEIANLIRPNAGLLEGTMSANRT